MEPSLDSAAHRQCRDTKIGNELHRENVMMSQQFDPEQFVIAAGDAIIAADTDGSIVLWEPAAERGFGYTESEALGRSLHLIISWRPRHPHSEGYCQVIHNWQ